MIRMGEPFDPSWRGRYPQVSPRDRDILDRFLDFHESGIKTLWYNVYVGEGLLIEDPENPEISEGFQQSTQRRIDVVVEFLDQSELHIAEVRPYAGPGALGSALTTWYLFKEEDQRPSVPAIITDRLATDMKAVHENFLVRVFEVGL